MRDLLADEKRCMNLVKESEGIYFDFSRERITEQTIQVTSQQISGTRSAWFHCQYSSHYIHCTLLCSMAVQLLLKLAEAAKLRGKIDAMFAGEHINSTEDRAVLHIATRARRDQVTTVFFSSAQASSPEATAAAACCTGSQQRKVQLTH